ncbi:MAG: hypothetical protein ACREA0_25125, partial [bacterium]
LKTLAQNPIDLAKNGDSKLRAKLQDIAGRLYRLKDLQQQGIQGIPEECNDGTTKVSLRQDVLTLVAKLQEHGLFLVPVGELESWLPILMRGQSREDKSKWAMLAAEKIEDVGERDEDVWRFIRTVYGYLERQLGSLVGVAPSPGGKMGRSRLLGGKGDILG